jgi:Leu/Phe-tRNA-protein transferase
MPTKEQISKLRQMDFELFDGYLENKHIDLFSGEILGSFEYDEKIGDLKVNIKKESSSTDPKDSEPTNKAS